MKLQHEGVEPCDAQFSALHGEDLQCPQLDLSLRMMLLDLDALKQLGVKWCQTGRKQKG